jgi:hypothetical protein
LLIWGPSDCSAVRWAKENRGVAEIVESEDDAALAAAIDHLARSAAYRKQLGQRALEVGGRYFSYESAEKIFFGALAEALRCDRLKSASGAVDISSVRTS